MDNANAQMTLAGGQSLSFSYLALVSVHTLLYVVAVLLVAIALLKRREIT